MYLLTILCLASAVSAVVPVQHHGMAAMSLVLHPLLIDSSNYNGKARRDCQTSISSGNDLILRNDLDIYHSAWWWMYATP